MAQNMTFKYVVKSKTTHTQFEQSARLYLFDQKYSKKKWYWENITI